MSRKKVLMTSFVAVILIFIIFYIKESMFSFTKITINDIQLVETKIDENNSAYEYGVNESVIKTLKKDNISLKRAIISCSFNNKSFINDIKDARFIFETDKELPSIIVGNHPDVGAFELNIKPNQTFNRGITILINPKCYSDDEIMEMLKNIRIKLITSKNEEIKIESQPISLVSGSST